MTLAAPIDLKIWFEANIQNFMGFAQTSVSPQPVHVFNGFMHKVLTGRRAPKNAIDFVATRTGGGWAVSNQDLRTKSRIALPKDDVRLDRARRAISSLIAADRAVFSGFASFQLAYPGLVTSDSTHLGIGDMAAHLAFLSPEGKPLLEQLLERLKAPQPNAHWAVEKLLSEPDVLTDVMVDDLQPQTWWASEEVCKSLQQDLSATLLRSLTLSVHSRDSLVGIEVLAITATWMALIAYAQVPALVTTGQMTPLLVEAGEPGARPSVRSASAEVISGLDARYQELVAARLLTEIQDRFAGSPPDGERAISYACECAATVKKLSGGNKLQDNEIAEIYALWRHDHEPGEALARTLQEVITSAMGNKSRDWFAAVGRHCGFVGPRRGHPARLRAEVSLIPSLVVAGLSDGDGPTVAWSVWTDRLASRFGLVVGPHPLAQSMLHRAAESELESNQADLEELLTSLGLARRYSDGVTEVMNPFFSWVDA